MCFVGNRSSGIAAILGLALFLCHPNVPSDKCIALCVEQWNVADSKFERDNLLLILNSWIV